MAEPQTLEEALEWYKGNRFSRKSLFEFVVARIKAAEDRVTAVEEQNRHLVSALVRGAQGPPEVVYAKPGTAEWDDTAPTTGEPMTIGTYNAMEQLRVEAEELGVKVDKRWGPATLADKVKAARSTYAAGSSNG